MVAVNKKDFNPNYFSDINSEVKAYLLGFIFADGSISKKTLKYSSYLSIHLSKKDESILKLFVKEIYPSKNILNLKSGTVKITIYSNKLVEDLIKLGVQYNKSYKEMRIPTGLSSELTRHFIRGFFDGDGCICSSSINAKKKQYVASIICTSNLFCKDIIKNLDIPFNYNIRKNKKGGLDIYRISFSGKKRLKLLYYFLYKDSSYFLIRKFNKFQDIIC